MYKNPEEHGAYVVFTSMADDRRSRRLQRQEVNAVALETPEFMHWSEKPISWSRADHPEVMPSPGSYALVLDATFATDRRAARFSRVLIDGGSIINHGEVRNQAKTASEQPNCVPRHCSWAFLLTNRQDPDGRPLWRQRSLPPSVSLV